LYNIKNIVDEIYKHGFYEIKNFYKQSDFIKLKKASLLKYKKPIMRDFNNSVYKKAVNKEAKSLLQGIAVERESRVSSKKLDVSSLDTQISISFPKKGIKFGNEKIGKNAFHYDDCYVSAVLPFNLPEQKSNGLMIYKNFRLNNLDSILYKILSRLLNKFKFLRLIFKPIYIPYEVGNLYLFFSDISLHGVDEIKKGERVSVTLNMSYTSYKDGYSRDILKKKEYRNFATGYEFLLNKD
jgi:hypothetical protein